MHSKISSNNKSKRDLFFISKVCKDPWTVYQNSTRFRALESNFSNSAVHLSIIVHPTNSFDFEFLLEISCSTLISEYCCRHSYSFCLINNTSFFSAVVILPRKSRMSYDQRFTRDCQFWWMTHLLADFFLVILDKLIATRIGRTCV